MIKRSIEVEISRNNETQKYAKDWDAFSTKELPAWKQDITDFTFKFSKFTNSGKLSKSEYGKLLGLPDYAKKIVIELAEQKLAKELQIEVDREKDLAEAQKLAEIVDATDFTKDDQPWTVIKSKTSHSDWYQNGGELNSPSIYYYCVPTSVAKEAKKLHDIRKKHEHDIKFAFHLCDYQTRKIRVADHDNGNVNEDMDDEEFQQFLKGKTPKSRTYHLKNWRDARGSQLDRATKIITDKNTNMVALSQLTKINAYVLRNYRYKPDTLERANWKTINKLAQAQDIATIQDTMSQDDAVEFAKLLRDFFNLLKEEYEDDPAMDRLVKRMSEVITSDPLAVCELFKAYINAN
jgi:sulfur relay (sulfurtransferase) DsrC/TusE family protein